MEKDGGGRSRVMAGGERTIISRVVWHSVWIARLSSSPWFSQYVCLWSGMDWACIRGDFGECIRTSWGDKWRVHWGGAHWDSWVGLGMRSGQYRQAYAFPPFWWRFFTICLTSWVLFCTVTHTL